MRAMIFVVSLPMSRSSLFGQQSPAAPYWRSCAGEEMKSAMIDVSYAASQTQILKPIHSKAIVSRMDLYLTVMCTMTSYGAADCHFRQDAHRRMASVIARIRCAEELQRGERARDHQTVNGEKLFMSVTSAECTEVLNGIPSHHFQTAPRPTMAILRRGRGAEILHRTYKWSSILQATKPRLPPDLFICGKFTARSTTTKCSSASLLTAPSTFAMQRALPLAKETLLHLMRFVPSPGYAQCPYSTARLEATVLKQVSWPPLAAYAAGQDYAA
jgi:hypothetical protein